MENHGILASNGCLPPSAFMLNPDPLSQPADVADQFSRFLEQQDLPQAHWNSTEVVRDDNWSSNAPTLEDTNVNNHGSIDGTISRYLKQLDFIEPPKACPSVAVSTIEALGTSKSSTARSRPTRLAKKILEDYFKVELYPDKTETNTIARKTKLSFKQVQQWFRNKRRRISPEELAKMQTETSKSSLPLTRNSLEALEREVNSSAPVHDSWTTLPRADMSIFGVDSPLMKPVVNEAMQTPEPGDLWYKATVPDYFEDPVEETFPPLSEVEDSFPTETGPYGQPKKTHAASIYSIGSDYARSTYSAGSFHSFGSAGTYHSLRSVHSSSSRISKKAYAKAPKQGGRKGRKLFAADLALRDDVPIVPLEQSLPPAEGQAPHARNEYNRVPGRQGGFYCTFCGKNFTTAYSWARHELEMHVEGEHVWKCGLDPVMSGTSRWCPYCHDQERRANCPIYMGLTHAEMNSHLTAHNHYTCVDKKEEELTFKRSQHLIQHLRHVHKVADIELRPATLRPTVNQSTVPPGAVCHLPCVFCDITSPTWEARKKHMLAHFKELQYEHKEKKLRVMARARERIRFSRVECAPCPDCKEVSKCYEMLHWEGDPTFDGVDKPRCANCCFVCP